MSVLNTIEQLQALNATVVGVKRTPVKYPGSLNSADLPAVIVWPGPGETVPVTARAMVTRTNREYSVRVFVEAVGQSDHDTPARDGAALLDRFLETYFETQVLADGHTQIVRVRDSGLISGTGAVVGGLATLTYAGVFYKGFVLSVNVLEIVGGNA